MKELKKAWLPLAVGVSCASLGVLVGVVVVARRRKRSRSTDSHLVQLPKASIPPVNELEHITSLEVLQQVCNATA